MSSKVSASDITTASDGHMGDTFIPRGVVGPKTVFRNNCRGLKLHCSYWIPDQKEVRGLVFLCHGFGEHLQWYEDLATRLLNTCDILAFGHDHVGHGRSEGTRGHVNNAQEYITDVLDHCEEVRKLHKGKPCFIVGHSLGGMIGIRAAMSRPFDGVVLVGPLIQPDPEAATPFKIKMAKVLALVLPLITVGKLNPDHVTRDEDTRKILAKDPLRYQGGFRARWVMTCHRELALLQEGMEKVTWPFLILHGANDRLCSPDAANLFYKSARSSDKKIKIIPHAYHHLYLEVNDVRQEALTDTVDWIAARLYKEPKSNGTTL